MSWFDNSQWEPPAGGSIRLTNPKTIQHWKDTGKFQELENDGYLFGKCGRFVLGGCICAKCTKQERVRNKKLIKENKFMSNFKKAALLKVRFSTTRGELSVEQLYTLKPADIKKIGVALKAELKKLDEIDNDFDMDSVPSKEVDLLKLKIELVKEIFSDMKSAADKVKADNEVRERKARLAELIAKKREEKDGEKSLEELEAEFKALG